ncbi:MAG TPA: V-type ATPase subunit [Anaerolineales bacterium]|nr:V-type ATPase subunit [Anaerolineales bacterium]
MAGGVSGYAAVNARVRVMYSYLLSAEDLTRLSQAPDLVSLVGALRQTAYGSYLDGLREQELTPEAIIFQVKRRLADVYQSVINAAPPHTRSLFLQLYRYYEINNLKAILRGIVTGPERNTEESLWDRVRPVLFPYGAMSVLPAQAMVESGSVASAVELLHGTPYYDVLAFAMKRYSAEQSLFPLEVALDLDYWRKLWAEARKLLGQDQGPATRIVGSLLDLNNIMWAIRYRVYQGLSEEETINYTLPFGYHVSDEDIRAIAAGADISAIVSRLYPEIPDAAALLEDPKRGLPVLEHRVKRYLMQQCLAAFVGNPFQVGVPLAFLVLIDLEVQDLTVLIEAKFTHVPVEDFRNFLLRTPEAA